MKFHDPDMGIQAEKRLVLESALRKAIAQEEFEVHYQPKADLKSGQISGVEALIRWRHPEWGLVSPGEFIPLAEKTKLIGRIGEWVLRTACAQAKAWQLSGYSDLSVAVNLSAQEFRQYDVPALVRCVLEETRLAPAHLELELTENLLMQDPELVVEMLGQLKSIGVALSLDDFGTGYSCLSHLKRFPIDIVKIDRSFVHDLATNPDDTSIIKAIIAMAQSMSMKTVAEGVETEEQLARLVANQCDQIQGYLLSAPIAAADMEALLRDGRCLPEHILRMGKPQQTLLLVDDEEYIIAALKRLLRREGYRVLTASSGEEGLELLAKNAVDVIVSDQRMPVMTGVEFLRRAKAMYPDTVRMVLSGYTELKSITDAINEGAIYKFLTKPWDDNQLRSHIDEAFRRKAVVDENRRLGQELKQANQELALVNKQLRELLEQKPPISGADSFLDMALGSPTLSS